MGVNNGQYITKLDENDKSMDPRITMPSTRNVKNYTKAS